MIRCKVEAFYFTGLHPSKGCLPLSVGLPCSAATCYATKRNLSACARKEKRLRQNGDVFRSPPVC